MSEPTPEFPTPVDESLSPFTGLHFLIIDDNPDGRFLIAKTLLRKFPNSVIVESQSAESAFRALEMQRPSLIVSHRTFEFDGIALIHELRSRVPDVPIIMASGIDRREAALAAGADGFLTYDEWLMVGNHVARLLTEQAAKKSSAATSQNRRSKEYQRRV